VFRRLLLAVVLCASAWTFAGHLVESLAADAPGRVEAAGGVSVLLDGAVSPDASPDAGHSAGPDADPEGTDYWWDAGVRTIASLTESVWRSQLHHAELAGVAGLQRFDPVRQRPALDHRTPQASGHLHRIPLLI
jgi:hypothetical protein